MKHFREEEWVDFVNRKVTEGKRTAMAQHLETGCRQCKQTAELWMRVQSAAKAESGYQPSAEDVRRAKAMFTAAGLHRPARASRRLVELLFDSFLQPAAAGERSASSSARQMLYRADSYQIDLHIESVPEKNRLAVTGQLFDVTHPQLAVRDFPVTIKSRLGKMVRMQTNQFGEFRGEIEDSGDLELSFPGRDEAPVVISLRNALGKVPGRKR